MNATVETARPEDLALQRLYHWEQTAPDKVILTQPTGGGAVREYTWRQVMDESRRMASHLKGLGHAPGSRIAILSKNTAHWLMCDFAIWMAGHVSVPLYPTLAAGTIRQILDHSEAKLLFVGKLDGWDVDGPRHSGRTAVHRAAAVAADFAIRAGNRSSKVRRRWPKARCGPPTSSARSCTRRGRPASRRA